MRRWVETSVLDFYLMCKQQLNCEIARSNSSPCYERSSMTYDKPTAFAASIPAISLSLEVMT